MDNSKIPCLATRFAPAILAHQGSSFLVDPIQASLTLHSEGALSVVWAPFDHIAPNVRLVVVGITPGARQAENAHVAFRTALMKGHPPVEAARLAKLSGAFSGSIRRNLVDMLDHIGAARVLGVPSCADVFDPTRELVHLTSALRHPVFFNGKDYNGTPDMLRTPVLRQMVETHLAAEVRALSQALWLPLGDKPAAALRHLTALGLLDADRVLDGLPHPSGANAERVAYFLGRKPLEALSEKTRPEPLDAARVRLQARLAHLKTFA